MLKTKIMKMHLQQPSEYDTAQSQLSVSVMNDYCSYTDNNTSLSTHLLITYRMAGEVGLIVKKVPEEKFIF